MVGQASIFDQVEQKKNEGIELVYRHADTEWKKAAADKLFEVAQKQKYFTSDDVLIPLEEAGVVTGNNSAIAAILLSASRMHLIRGTDNYKKSRRPSRHHGIILEWESLIYKAAT